MNLFEKRYNALRSEYDINSVAFDSALIALQEASKELGGVKELDRAAENLKTAIIQIRDKINTKEG